MKNFTDYAEKAIVRYNLTGYNNLAREIGITKASMSALRAGKTIPADSTMIKLAELAGLPKEEALIDLNLWRSKDKPELQKVWQRLAKMIGAVALVAVTSTFSAKDCFANEILMKAGALTETHTLYYATNLLGYIQTDRLSARLI